MVKCPYCKNDCPRPILPGWYRCEWCDNHFLTHPKKEAKEDVMALRRQQQQI